MVEWLNKAYDVDVLYQAARSFNKLKNVQLLSFLSKKGLKEFKKLNFKRVYDPQRHSYGVSKPPQFARSKEFKAIMQLLVGEDVNVKEMACYSFNNGDYTVLYDKLKPGKGVALLLDVVEWGKQWGGYTSFVKGSEEVWRVVPQRNALSLVDQSGLRMFTKYVNHHAKHPRVFLYAVLQ